MANYVAIYLILVIAIVMVRSGFALEIMTFAKWCWSGRKNVLQSGLGMTEKLFCRVLQKS